MDILVSTIGDRSVPPVTTRASNRVDHCNEEAQIQTVLQIQRLGSNERLAGSQSRGISNLRDFAFGSACMRPGTFTP